MFEIQYLGILKLFQTSCASRYPFELIFFPREPIPNTSKMAHNHPMNPAETMSRAFTSANLLYKPFSASPDSSDKKFFYKLQNDPISFGQADISLFRPQRKEDTADQLSNMLKDSLLCVKICLKSNKTAEGESQDSAIKSEDVDEEGLTPIGFVCFPGLSTKRPHMQSASLGIQLFSQYTGKGYGSEAIKWAVNWAFRFANVHRVSIGSFGYNPRALALYERLGFVNEGGPREAIFWDGKWWDEVSLGMLRSEWEVLRDQGKI
jgi:GNAT superfamily N-acetyltransferase